MVRNQAKPKPQPHMLVENPTRQLTRICRRSICRYKQTPLVGQQLWVDESERARALTCSMDEKKANYSKYMINDMWIQKARGNHCIKDCKSIMIVCK